MNREKSRARLSGDVHIEFEMPWDDGLENPVEAMEVILAVALRNYFGGLQPNVVVNATNVSVTAAQ